MKRKVWVRLGGIVLLSAALGGCMKQYNKVSVSEAFIKAETSRTETSEMGIASTAEAPEEPVAASGEYYTFEERREEDGKIRSFLTGELVDTAIGTRRPAAVMMSNDKAALPQYGLNRAGVVYEAPVEGDMNRYMAIIEEYDDLERIGSLRSCRTYYTYFAREFDAIYAHYGQSTFAKPYLSNVDNINGVEAIGNVAYYRTRDKKSPHNAYTSGERLKKAIVMLGYTTDYDKAYEGHYRFARAGFPVTLEGAENVSGAYLVYPGYKLNKPWFEYNESDGLYYRYQYGNPHMGDEGQIKVKNILFQYCPSSHYATTDYLDINVHDKSYGCYITGGQAIPVKWDKDGEFGLTHYYDMENKEIILNQGKTWVCIIPAQDSPNVELYGKQ